MSTELENRQTDITRLLEQDKKDDGMSLKAKIGFAILGAAGVAGLVYLGSKVIKKIIAAKSDANSFEEGSPATVAKQIKMAFENDGNFGTDTKALRAILVKVKNRKELEDVRKEYQKQFNAQLFSDLKSELQSTEYNEMLQIMEGKPEKPGLPPTAKQYLAWAKRLKAAFDKMYSFIPGTDEAAILAVINELPTQQAFTEVGKAYQREYKRDFIKDFKGELSSTDYYGFMKIVTSKQKN
jgi:uncharacterized protein (UPF0335 family)